MKPKKRKPSAKQSSDRQPAATPAIISIEGPDEGPLSSTQNISQGLKFVDVTPRYLQGTWTPAEQKGIRIHVMQDFLRQRKEAVDVAEPPAMAATISSHVHRFRIVKPHLPGDEPIGIALSQKVAASSEQSCRSTHSKSSRDIPEPEEAILASTEHPSQCEALLAQERTSTSPLRISPNLPGVVARMDPFARLPIDGSVDTHELLDYYRTSYWSNSLAINPDGRWLSIAATDPALFHAQLSLVTQHRALSRGKPFPEQYYYHRGMAISIVTSRLAHPVEAISDPTIGAVALLANSDNYFDVPAEAQHSHIKGLLSLVQLRGGLHTLSANEPVKRVVTWADLVHAAANDCTPYLDISKCNAGYDLEQVFPGLASADSPARTIYPKEPPVPALLKDVFETIRLLTIAQSSSDMVDLKSTVNRRILANVLYRAEYLLLDPLLLPLGVSVGQKDSKELSYSDFWTPLFSATTAGALIFTYSCLRDLAIQSRPFQRLARRLRLNLQLVFEQGCALLDQERNPSSINANPSLLLWLLLHGFKATPHGHRESDREWFIRRGAEMCNNLKIQSLEELRLHVKQVVAFRVQCVVATEAFWEAICGHQDPKSSCVDDI